MSYSRRQVVSMLAGGAVSPACPSLSRAQAYPSRPIRLVVPFPPGGAFDTVGRPWAEAIRPHLGTVVVENMGAQGHHWVPLQQLAQSLMAIQSCLAALRPTSMKPY